MNGTSHKKGEFTRIDLQEQCSDPKSSESAQEEIHLQNSSILAVSLCLSCYFETSLDKNNSSCWKPALLEKPWHSHNTISRVTAGKHRKCCHLAMERKRIEHPLSTCAKFLFSWVRDSRSMSTGLKVQKHILLASMMLEFSSLEQGSFRSLKAGSSCVDWRRADTSSLSHVFNRPSHRLTYSKRSDTIQEETMPCCKDGRAPYENFTQSPGTSKALHSSSVDAAGIQQASSSVQDDVHFWCLILRF